MEAVSQSQDSQAALASGAWGYDSLWQLDVWQLRVRVSQRWRLLQQSPLLCVCWLCLRAGVWVAWYVLEGLWSWLWRSIPQSEGGLVVSSVNWARHGVPYRYGPRGLACLNTTCGTRVMDNARVPLLLLQPLGSRCYGTSQCAWRGPAM
jgi:hypothetical protein